MLSLTIAFLVLTLQVSNNPTQSSLYDYCLLGESEELKSDPVVIQKIDKALKPGEPPDRLRTFVKAGQGKKSFRIVLVPVGYQADKIDAIMLKLIKVLQVGFVGVKNMSFSYAYPSYEVEFVHDEQIIGPKNWDEVKKLKKVFQDQSFDAVVLILNARDYLATAYDTEEVAIVADFEDYVKYFLIHETAHLLGLDDGYKPPTNKKWSPNSELFFGTNSLLPLVTEAYKGLRSPPGTVLAGKCLDHLVYRFEGSDKSIMTKVFWSDEKPLFTKFQLRMMNLYIWNNKNKPAAK